MILSKKHIVRSEEHLQKFRDSNNLKEVKYGLPKEITFCVSCVNSNQVPVSEVEFKHTIKTVKKAVQLDTNGVCDACKFAEIKANGIDWKQRELELRELCDKHRSTDGSYDCIVPGSGGKDSFMQSHILKYKYGMNPLTITWAPHMYTDWGYKNFMAWLNSGFDNILITPNPLVHRLLTRLSVENLFHPFQPFILGQKGLAPKLADKFNIPLIFYGENEAEYHNPVADNSSALRDWKYFTESNEEEVFLGGTSIHDLKGKFGLKSSDLEMYMPINPETATKKKIEVHYLGYYLSWHPQGAYYYAVENGGFQAAPERTQGTYSKYNSIDDKIDDFHYYTTYIKFGVGRTTYDAAQEVRNGEIDRDEALALVKKFDGEYPDRFEKEIFEYLSIPENEYPTAHKQFEHPVMTREYFKDLEDYFRSPHIWRLTDKSTWDLRGKSWS
jgi:N-acetyl sugar amidotransferase